MKAGRKKGRVEGRREGRRKMKRRIKEKDKEKGDEQGEGAPRESAPGARARAAQEERGAVRPLGRDPRGVRLAHPSSVISSEASENRGALKGVSRR